MSSSARTYQNLPIRTGSSSAGNVPQSIICWVARALIPCRACPRPAATDPSPAATAYHPSRNRTPIPGSGSRSSETLPSRRASPSRHRRRRSGERPSAGGGSLAGRSSVLFWANAPPRTMFPCPAFLYWVGAVLVGLRTCPGDRSPRLQGRAVERGFPGIAWLRRFRANARSRLQRVAARHGPIRIA